MSTDTIIGAGIGAFVVLLLVCGLTHYRCSRRRGRNVHPQVRRNLTPPRLFASASSVAAKYRMGETCTSLAPTWSSAGSSTKPIPSAPLVPLSNQGFIQDRMPRFPDPRTSTAWQTPRGEDSMSGSGTPWSGRSRS